MNLPYAVYILKCSNRQFYTGFSANLKQRLHAHSKGEVHFTEDKLPVELVYVSYFVNKQKAYDYERYLKSSSGIKLSFGMNSILGKLSSQT
ncbi:MAG: GIY-YIG nuclease family protein [Bacteroidota bacterium]